MTPKQESEFNKAVNHLVAVALRGLAAKLSEKAEAIDGAPGSLSDADLQAVDTIRDIVRRPRLFIINEDNEAALAHAANVVSHFFPEGDGEGEADA